MSKIEQVNFRVVFNSAGTNPSTNVIYRSAQDAFNPGPRIMFPVNQNVKIKAIGLFIGSTTSTNFTVSNNSIVPVSADIFAVFSVLDANGQPFKNPVGTVASGSGVYLTSMQNGTLMAGRDNEFNKVVVCDNRDNFKDLTFLDVFGRGLRVETVSTNFKVADAVTRVFQVNGFIYYEIPA
jgi:hypothetical protein